MKDNSFGNTTTSSEKKIKGLTGTWIHHDKYGFGFIEIEDTSNAIYCKLIDRKSALKDSVLSDRYWYYKSNAKISYSDSSTICISTENFRFDFKITGDSLIEFDKAGKQDIFIKVSNDIQLQ